MYTHTASKWVVEVLSEGVGHNIAGLCVVTLSNNNSALNIYQFPTGKHLLTCQRKSIKFSGCIESLILLLVDGTCYGGPGVLWIQQPVTKSLSLEEQLDE